MLMKEEIVQKFLNEGKLLTPQALDLILSNEGIAVRKTEFLITEKDLDMPNVLVSSFKIIKNLTSKKTEITPEDFAKFYRSRFEKTKNIILEKMQKPFTSLNKLSNFRDEVYVIGIIREIREKDGKKIVELEDATGSVSVVFDKDTFDAELDDVIAVLAVSSKNVLFGKQIIYPDVPLRSPATGKGKVCFVGSLNLNEASKADGERFFSWFGECQASHLFCAGDVGDINEFERLVERYCSGKTIVFTPGGKESNEEYPQLPISFNSKKIISLSNPAMIELNGVKILMMHKFSMEMLRKRYLGKSNVILDEDFLVLEEIPDIVCFGHSEKPHITNYKSITVVNSGSLLSEFRPILIDLETREAQQISVE